MTVSTSTSKNIRDVTKSLQVHFAGPKLPVSLPTETRRMLQAFVDDHDGRLDAEEAIKANQELKLFWDRHVGGAAQKLGAFAGVLKELRPAMADEDDMLDWYQLAVKPVLASVGFKKAAVEDAQDFVASVMIYDEDDRHVQRRSRTSSQICSDLLDIYMERTRGLAEDDVLVAPDNAQIAQQVEAVLVTFGKKMPRLLFNSLDDLVVQAETRLQALTLLSSFLRHQAPHLYTVIHTPLVDHLLKCLMNDTCTTVLSVAVTSLIMLLPHVPASLDTRLPRLFLVYSRLLCWERFSALSTAAQKSLVTDDRVASDGVDHGDVGIDPNWEKCRPSPGVVESTTPEVRTYFTYLYGLYPLNFMSYIRKPRRFLKNLDFPGADDFDLDQAVIRGRSDQFRQSHLLHPNFYHMTVEEELIDPKWPRMDPADVVAECHGLVVDVRSPLQAVSPAGPPPSGKLPDLPPPPLPLIPAGNNGSISPAVSHASLRSAHSWRDTQLTSMSGTTMTDGDSPVLGPQDDAVEMLRPRSKGGLEKSRTSLLIDEFPLPSACLPSRPDPPSTNLAYLQREITLLRNDLNFERWHKSQYSQHIGQVMRKNVKDATVEAETLNLINANRALKQQLEQVRSAREATIKDSNLTRKQANNLETNMTERFNKMKKEQETWAADAEELRKLRAEMKTYRDLLSESEARELKTSHELEIVKRNLGQLKKLEKHLEETRRKVREYEYKEWDYEQAKREHELLQAEKETLQMRVRRQEQDLERTKRMYTERISELEAQISNSSGHSRPASMVSARPESALAHAVMQRELDDSRAKLTQLKKAHTRLLERYTDLELEYQSVKSQLTDIQDFGAGASDYPDPSRRNSLSGTEVDQSVASGAVPGRPGVLESVYALASEYEALSGVAYTNMSVSDPTPNRHLQSLRGLPVSPISPPRSELTRHSSAGLTWKPTEGSSTPPKSSVELQRYNTTRPLAPDERSVVSEQSVESGGGGGAKKQKIDAKSDVRVYGRGGAQNIKLSKEKEPTKDSKPKAGGLGRALGKGLGLS